LRYQPTPPVKDSTDSSVAFHAFGTVVDVQPSVVAWRWKPWRSTVRAGVGAEQPGPREQVAAGRAVLVQRPLGRRPGGGSRRGRRRGGGSGRGRCGGGRRRIGGSGLLGARGGGGEQAEDEGEGGDEQAG
jgi:hypothetical protein